MKSILKLKLFFMVFIQLLKVEFLLKLKILHFKYYLKCSLFFA